MVAAPSTATIAGRPAANPSHSDQQEASQELRFNRELWRRFRVLAQPYFYPSEQGGVAWALLLVVLLFAVVGGTYWLAVGGAAAVLSLLPAHYVPSSLPDTYEKAMVWPWPLLAAACIVATILVVYPRRENLKGRWHRWGMLGLLLFLLFCVTGLNVYISYVFRDIDNKLAERDKKGYDNALFGYGMALVIAVPVIGFYRFMQMALARHWRSFLCMFFLERYLAQRAYYKLDSNSDDTDIDNPDQRITEDIHYFTSETLSFLLDILGGILDLFSFAAILWATSRPLMGSLLAYASVGTIIALVIGQRLVEINYENLRKEADLRYSLIHIRDNAEAIAFYGGEALESAGVQERLELVMCNYDRLVRWTFAVTVYQRMFFYLARLVPYLVIGGLYFAKQVDFGTVGQGAFAFSMVLSSVTLIIDRIKEISRFSAGINRLGSFYDQLTDLGSSPACKRNDAQVVGREEELTDLLEKPRAAATEIHTVVAPGAGVEVSAVTLQTPTGRVLVDGLRLELAGALGQEDGRSSRCLLIVGPSGFGKSSVLRAIAGLWTRGAGEVRRPPTGEMLFLPQKPYMPLGDLRTQLLYPNLLAETDDQELLATLAHLGLGDLPARFSGGFDAVQDWSRVLSGGEQQRLAAARCLVATPAPAIVVLDEATSALPVKDEANLYQLFRSRDISYISVGHRESLLDYHDLVLEICGGGAWRLLQPREYKLRSPGQLGEGGDSPKQVPSSAGRNGPASGGELRRREGTSDSGSRSYPPL